MVKRIVVWLIIGGVIRVTSIILRELTDYNSVIIIIGVTGVILIPWLVYQRRKSVRDNRITPDQIKFQEKLNNDRTENIRK